MATVRARRPPRVPEWLTQVAQPSSGPVPWVQMGHAVLAIAVPMAAGLASGHLVPGVLAGVGGLIATMADRTGPYLMRVRRVAAAAAVFGGAAGLLIGTAINGRGWVAVPVMIVVAGVSALLSSVGAVWSAAGMFLLIYTTLSTGPLGALRPWWLTPLWFLAGVGWWLVLLVPGWLAFPGPWSSARSPPCTGRWPSPCARWGPRASARPAAAPTRPSAWPLPNCSASGRPQAAGIGSWPC